MSARQAAVKAAGFAAVEKSLAHFTLNALLADFHLNGNVYSPIPYVKIESSEILEEAVINDTGQKGAATEASAYMVKVKAALCRKQKEPLSSLRLSVALDKPVFNDGEEMQIKIRASHDCHYAVYMVTEDQSVARLVPSRLKNDNVLKANEIIVFPSNKEMEKGIRLRAHVATEGVATTETLLVLALRKEQMETDVNMDEAVFGLYDGQTAHLTELVRRIATIPLNHRCEYLIRYAIRPRP